MHTAAPGAADMPTDPPAPRLHLVKPRRNDHDERDALADSHGGALGGDFGGDAETVVVDDADFGGPVDAVDVAPTLSWKDVTATGAAGRAPIVPTWLTNRAQRAATLAAIGDNLRYWALFHLARTPKYLAKTAVYAPIGAARLLGRTLRWASAEDGNWQLRQHAANTNDAYTWQSLNRTRAKEARGRWWLVGVAAVAAPVALLIVRVSDVVPSWGWYAVEAAAVLLLARAGRPADKPITDRVSNAPRFTKLTGEMVRNALVSLGLPAMKEPSTIEFVHPGIHRDGPGWLARVNLPQGLEAVKVLERRGMLSSALRLPVDQVWPSPGPEHAGQVDLWVGYQPASKMGQSKWSIAAPNARTSVFEEHEFGSNERQQPVKTSLFARSFVIAGQPGSGKSYAARALVLMASQDPTVEFKIAEFKGTGDFIDLAPICSTYVVGVDDKAIAEGAAIIMWGLAEAERRGKRVLAAKQRGEAPEGKVTPELARKPGSGLHPVVIVIDEAHELFGASAEAADAAERLIKRARALNIIVILATQIPDRTSLPPNIVRCVTNRWCLSVAGQVENDMVLGTGAYKRGITGTVYRPVIDAGWGCMTGLAAPTAVRSQYPTPEVAAEIVARAVAIRGGAPVGGSADLPTARDLLADLAEVSASNGQHWAPAADALTERWPNAYPGLTADALSELARAAGVQSVTVKVGGRPLKGYRLDALRELISTRAATPTEG
ncbi:AAA family ATPase [Dactylosporangium aurantiacum]|nr:AAA family ATPase [Dactylosporangium aurantiacum]MDG6108140.1 AAA family ATPase [Dactylosporangium aurantiacum]